ncbi:polyadenylate-binding protein 1A-like [Osmerus eperlanus]|uniref:polyadenylate-binding protein 1A-like n=1 Tax=Osmerus eperlanus TaxID=29151 RepID=UPI002E126D4C
MYGDPGVCDPQQHMNDMLQVAMKLAVCVLGQEPLAASVLAAALPQDQMQMLGEWLYHLIQGIQPSLVVRVTVMLLELDNTDIASESPDS